MPNFQSDEAHHFGARRRMRVDPPPTVHLVAHDLTDQAGRAHPTGFPGGPSRQLKVRPRTSSSAPRTGEGNAATVSEHEIEVTRRILRAERISRLAGGDLADRRGDHRPDQCSVH